MNSINTDKMKERFGQLIYEGKAKKIYQDPNVPRQVWMEFKDDLTAFNAQKKGSFADKGRLNGEMATLIFRYLRRKGIASHFVQWQTERYMQVEKVKIVPLEVVVRNSVAGSLAKRFHRPEGGALTRPVVEFYFKDDGLSDPFVSDDQILAMGLAPEVDLMALKTAALEVNVHLKDIFGDLGFRLIDFKLEFGRDADGKLLLADEITPDCCRLWDAKTLEKYDKDRFRNDLGGVAEAYAEVHKRLCTYMSHIGVEL